MTYVFKTPFKLKIINLKSKRRSEILCIFNARQQVRIAFYHSKDNGAFITVNVGD